jgi:hypothetical protein
LAGGHFAASIEQRVSGKARLAAQLGGATTYRVRVSCQFNDTRETEALRLETTKLRTEN